MVVFTCQYCNASLKKKAVESHRFQCQRNYHLTCIDCLQDFFGNEYVKHVSCLTEEQRYGGKSYTPSSAAGKQVAWVSAINAALKSNNLSNQVKEVLDAAASNPNVPRNKKKFLNYFQNMGAFKFNKFLNQAFDAADAEFKKFEAKSSNKSSNSPQKTDSSKQSDEAIKKKEKKRKTISETQEDAENIPERTNVLEAKNKKKKKNRDGNNCEQVNGDMHDNGERKSKKKKKKSVSLEEDQVVEEEEQEGSRKNKKNKEASVNGYVIDISADNDVETKGELQEVDPASQALSEELAKLSKKERKKYLKQLKYEAEINSIENYNKENEEYPIEAGEKKKKKKDKTVNGEIESKISFSEPDGKKPKLEEEEEQQIQEPPPKPKKFRWDRLILQVLRNAPEQEMSLKRLSRKVCGEYQLIYGDKESYDDILLMFNKKVIKTHGVRVFKDRAKIVSG